MKTEIKELFLNYLMVFGIILIFLVGIFAICYFFLHSRNICVASPFVYGANEMEEVFNGNVTGTVIVLRSDRTLTFNFDSTTIKPTK